MKNLTLKFLDDSFLYNLNRFRFWFWNIFWIFVWNYQNSRDLTKCLWSVLNFPRQTEKVLNRKICRSGQIEKIKPKNHSQKQYNQIYRIQNIFRLFYGILTIISQLRGPYEATKHSSFFLIFDWWFTSFLNFFIVKKFKKLPLLNQFFTKHLEKKPKKPVS